MIRSTTLLAMFGLALPAASQAADPPPLVLEAKIPLGMVSGRIDHMALDPERHLLFVAELGNDSVSVVDLDQGKVTHRLSGLREPQGVLFHRPTATLYVANAGDGSLRLYRAPQFTPVGRLELGDDADNVRLDGKRDRVVVGYGDGALATIDPSSRRKVGDIKLPGHPESFQFDREGSRIFVNVPDAHEISVVDLAAGRRTGALPSTGARSNFPMAIDGAAGLLAVVYRSPAKLALFAMPDGKPLANLDACDDADDVFFDAARQRIYVSCGQGVIDVFAQANDGYARTAEVRTVRGARTSLFAPGADRLYLAVRGYSREPAAIWVFRPQP